MNEFLEEPTPSTTSTTTISSHKKPQKRYFRQRAHSNPIADHSLDYPIKPDDVDWSLLYPFYFKNANDKSKDVSNENQFNQTTDDKQLTNNLKKVEFLDIGCGYGGLLIKLSELYPDNLSLGMEIRVKVSDYVQERIKSLRSISSEKDNNNQYQNCACLRMNAMKYLPNYFHKHQLSKMFFLFPDPHFKKQKHKWRIISQQLLGEYAYLLKPDARVYFVTDVKELYDWMYNHFKRFPLFEELSKEEIDADPIVPHLFDSSEEGKKVTRNNGEKFCAVFKRIEKA